jgi:replicative DNA helicase
MMKSGTAGSSALTVARRGDYVQFFSMEMTLEQITARALTDLAYSADDDPLPYQDILNEKPMEERPLERLRRASQRLKDAALMIDPQPGLTAAEITLRTRRRAEFAAKKGATLGLVVIDHLGKVRSPDRRGESNRNIELGDITNAMAELAKELDTCVMVLCQLNRNVDGRPNRRPQLSDLRESGHIEEDADVVIGLYREAYYLSKAVEDDPDKEARRIERLQDSLHDLELIVLKNRHGNEGVAHLWVDPASSAVRNKARY